MDSDGTESCSSTCTASEWRLGIEKYEVFKVKFYDKGIEGYGCACRSSNRGINMRDGNY